MTTTALKEKILDLEAQITLIKMSVFKKPDFNVDERNWTKVYKETYGKKLKSGLYFSLAS